MPYLCVGIELRQDLEPERVEQSCLDAGALSITLTDTRDDPVLEPALGEVRLWPATRLRALFSHDANAALLLTALRNALGLAPDRFEVSMLEDRVWEREWLKDFHAMCFGERLWIAPTHEPVTEPGAVVIALDPGLAFGTGSHATTALCLGWLDGHAPRGASVIDYGCGSGVLAIAAVKLGAATAICWDLDPQAWTATRENAERNGVAGSLRIASSEEALPRGVDLLLANILAAPLRALAPRFAELVRPQGRLVLAGLLEADAAEVTAAYASWFDMSSFGSREGWIGLAGVRLVHDLP